MTEQAKISIDLSTGKVDIEAPVNSLSEIFDHLEGLLPKLGYLTEPDKVDEEKLVEHESSDPENGGKAEEPETPSKPKRRTRGAGKPESYKAVDLGLSQEERTEFKSFYESKSPKTQSDHLIVVIYWLLKNTAREKLTVDEIFTGLRTVGEKVPKRISSVLSNLAIASFITKENNEPKILHIGEDYVDRELPKKAAK